MIHNASFSMKTFMDHVNSANWHFTLKASSLKELIVALGGAYDKTKGVDQRQLDRQQLMVIQGIIWPLGDGVQDSPWGKKKNKYKNALGYLARQLFALDEADALLVGSYKTGWESRILRNPMKFVSGSHAQEAELATSGGLSKRFASELCIPADGMIGDWDLGHKFVFGSIMRLESNGRLKSAGAIKNQGFGGNTYCFQRRVQTPYMCMMDIDVIDWKGEVAFPDDVNNSSIKVFSGGVPKPHQVWTASDWIDDVVAPAVVAL